MFNKNWKISSESHYSNPQKLKIFLAKVWQSVVIQIRILFPIFAVHEEREQCSGPTMHRLHKQSNSKHWKRIRSIIRESGADAIYEML